MTLRQLLLILLLASAPLACQRSQPSADTRQTRTFESERSNFFNSLMTPSVLARQLKSAIPEFHPELMSDAKMYSHYASNEVKSAANLGIYLADLNYVIAYSQTGLAKEYFEASYELSRAAGIEQKVLEFLKARYQRNLKENDSVAAVVDDLLAKSTRGLEGTRKERLAGIAMAAYQIENLHLALGLYSNATTADDAQATLFKMVMGQRANVETIYNFLKTYTDPLDPDANPNYPYYANALLELMEVYRKIDTGEDRNLSETGTAAKVNDKVDALRNKILSIG